MVAETRTRCVPETVCETQTIQCVKKVCETVSRQVPCTYTVCDPVPVTRVVSETKMVCTPRTVTRQIPVEVCTKVPVVVHCPTPTVASSQDVAATPQGVVTH
jgi:hypothetical protein